MINQLAIISAFLLILSIFSHQINGQYVGAYGTCGGQGYIGPKICQNGLKCMQRNNYYSQCRPDCPNGWACKHSSTQQTGRINDNQAGTSSSSISSAVISESEFQNAITQNGYSPAPTHEQYLGFASQLRSIGGITTKREAAMFLSQIIWESGGLKYKKELACIDTGCPGSYSTNIGYKNKYYYGRGYIQLSWDYNYLACSLDLFEDDRLLKNPDQVADSEQISWATTFWFWKKNVGLLPDVKVGHFGAATNAINGGLECRGGYQDKAKKRFNIYQVVLKVFGIHEIPIESGCYN